MHGVVAALGGADGIGATRIAGFATQRIIATLAVDAADRMDRSQIQHVEAKRGDLGQSVDAIIKGAVLANDLRLAAGHPLVPGTCPRDWPVGHPRISAIRKTSS